MKVETAATAPFLSMPSLLVRLGIREEELNKTFVPVGNRTISTSDTVTSYLSNNVTTGKYQVYNFLPKFIFEFFSSYANLFFLFTGSIQLIGDLSPTSRYGTAIPLSIVFILQASKELIEDSKRHKMDREVNFRKCQVIQGRSFTLKSWKDVKIGDVVRVSDKEYFPCDLVLLSSSEPDALCYIETANLDGETNLKIRQGLTETSHLLTPESVSNLNAEIKSELPNNSLYTFEATMKWNGQELPLSPQQLLLRGAQLRNTKWVYGISVFTGHETKLMMNSTSTPIKRTKVTNMVNSQIIFLFIMLVFIAVAGAFGQLYTEVSTLIS